MTHVAQKFCNGDAYSYFLHKCDQAKTFNAQSLMFPQSSNQNRSAALGLLQDKISDIKRMLEYFLFYLFIYLFIYF